MHVAILTEPPFCFFDDGGDPAGCDVDVARMASDALGLEPFRVSETSFSELLPGLAAGKWQMTTGLFVTAERERLVDFSIPIWALADGLLVRTDNPASITGYRSITSNDTLVLAAIRGQVQHQTALELGVQAEQIHVFDTYAEAARAVASGMADAYASVARAHAEHLRRNPEAGMTVVPIAASEKAPAIGAFAFRKNDTLREAIDAWLKSFIGSPSHRRLMENYGFSNADIDLVLRR